MLPQAHSILYILRLLPMEITACGGGASLFAGVGAWCQRAGQKEEAKLPQALLCMLTVLQQHFRYAAGHFSCHSSPPSSMSSFLSTMTSKIPLSMQLCPRLFPSCSRNTVIGLFYFLQGQSSLSTSSQPNPAPDPTHEPPVLMGLLCGYRPPKAALSLSSQAGSCAAG